MSGQLVATLWASGLALVAIKERWEPDYRDWYLVERP